MRTRLVAAVVVVALVGSILAGGVVDPTHAGADGGGTVDLSGAVPATFTVTPGVEQLTVTGATARAPLTLVHAGTLERIVTLFTDDLGQLVFQYVPNDFLVHDPQTQGVLPTVSGSTVPPGSYRVVSEGVPGEPFAGPVEASDPFAVLSIDDLPDTSLYEGQTLPFVPSALAGGAQPGWTDEDGFGYLETRDGTLLSINVRLPDPTVYGPGPYPTVVQYSGYAPSRPGTPSGADAGGMLAGVLGFAYVGVNIRGSGCSGGVFDAFNAAQAADGYDVIETVARQPWVKNGKVGMMGISYSGITQLYVGATQPPSLAAITPLSVIEDPWYQQWPGGVYNAGFTQQWLAQRDDEANGGAQWVQDRIAGGDTVCASNKEIRTQNIPFEEFARSLERRPDAANDRNLSLLVQDIVAPVFLVGAWQDEQTGSRFGLMLDDFDSVPAGQAKFTLYNGHHPDSLSPLVMSRWFEFLSFYVDQTIPKLNPLVRAGAPVVFEQLFGTPGMSFEPDRFLEADGVTPVHGDFAGARVAFEAEDPVRVLFEVGASPDFAAYPGAHRERFEMTFPSWPPPDATPRTFYLGSDGALTDVAPVTPGVDRYSFDADILDERYYVNGDHGSRQVNNDWQVTPDGLGLAYESDPLAEELVIAGEGHVDLWIRSTGTDVPIEVVLSEVYADPDGEGGEPVEEVRVQHGLLRAGYRTVDPARSSGTQIDHLYYASDYQPLPAGEFVNVQVPLYSAAHPFRAGSRVRIEINTPGGDAALWDFESDDFGATTHDLAHGGAMPSSLVLPVLPDSDPDRALPAEFADQSVRPDCDSLRGQPCRLHQPMVNESLPVPPEDLGYLRVTTDPALPVDISVDGVVRDGWGLNWLSVPVGSHEVCFEEIEGWAAPPCETVEVLDETTTELTGQYTQRGYLQVTTSPALPATISVDGVPMNDWGVWTDVEPGTHEVCFGAVDGWQPPSCEDVEVTAGANATFEGQFTEDAGAAAPTDVGFLRVTTDPPVGARIIVDGDPRDSWGLNWLKVPEGEHEVCFGSVPDTVAPPCQTVDVAAGETVEVVGDYELEGTLRVLTDPPLAGVILVDGWPANAWGVWRSIPAGDHEVCFWPLTGLVPPSCQTATVTAGALSEITATYG